jgi:hypothetical protein
MVSRTGLHRIHREDSSVYKEVLVQIKNPNRGTLNSRPEGSANEIRKYYDDP